MSLIPVTEMKILRFREFTQREVGVGIPTKNVRITSLSSGCLRKRQKKCPSRKRKINLPQKISKAKLSRAWDSTVTLCKSNIYTLVHPQDQQGRNDCKRSSLRRIRRSINSSEANHSSQHLRGGLYAQHCVIHNLPKETTGTHI